MANVIGDLTKEKELLSSQESEVLTEFEEERPHTVESAPKEVFGEIKFDNKEGEILKQIGELKAEKEREVKEVQTPGVVATSSPVDVGVADDDTDDTNNVPIKYYGYQVSESAFDDLETKAKMKQSTTAPWLAVWLMRLLQKN